MGVVFGSFPSIRDLLTSSNVISFCLRACGRIVADWFRHIAEGLRSRTVATFFETACLFDEDCFTLFEEIFVAFSHVLALRLTCFVVFGSLDRNAMGTVLARILRLQPNSSLRMIDIEFRGNGVTPQLHPLFPALEQNNSLERLVLCDCDEEIMEHFITILPTLRVSKSVVLKKISLRHLVGRLTTASLKQNLTLEEFEVVGDIIDEDDAAMVKSLGERNKKIRWLRSVGLLHPAMLNNLTDCETGMDVIFRSLLKWEERLEPVPGGKQKESEIAP
jgi:hypothetical protein